jgi:hypothetical protein
MRARHVAQIGAQKEKENRILMRKPVGRVAGHLE